MNYKNLIKIVNTRAVHGASEEDESINPIEVVENQVQKVNITSNVTPKVAVESKTKIFDITNSVIKYPLARIQENHTIFHLRFPI